VDFRLCSCGCGGELHAYELTSAPLITLRPTIPPSAEPLSLALTKQHLRVIHTLEDALIMQYIASARRAVEVYIEQSIALQGWEATVGGVAGSLDPIPLPMGPVKAVQAVAALTPDGSATPITGFILYRDTLSAPLEGWPVAPAAVRVTYTAGMQTPPPEPPLLQAMLLLVGEEYDHRAAVVTGTIVAEMPHAIGFLLDPYRQSTGLTVV
jgi:uncharacterized phiE125 gp8 family phage protein